jgi:hypothetical protein
MQFDVQINSDGGTAYTPAFTAAEKVCVQCNVEQKTVNTGTLTVTPQHSADGGRTWLDKTALTMTASGAFAANAVTAMFGGDAGATPHHAMMRLKLVSTRIIGVRVFVNGRGRARPRLSLVYDGAVPNTSLYSPSFRIEPGGAVALHVLVTPIGASTTPTITAQLEVGIDHLNWVSQASAEVNGVSVTGRQENAVPGSLDIRAAKGSVGRRRLATGGGSSDNTTHVRVYATAWVRPPKAVGVASKIQRLETEERERTTRLARPAVARRALEYPFEPQASVSADPVTGLPPGITGPRGVLPARSVTRGSVAHRRMPNDFENDD